MIPTKNITEDHCKSIKVIYFTIWLRVNIALPFFWDDNDFYTLISYYLSHSWGCRRIHTFSKCICAQVNVTIRIWTQFYSISFWAAIHYASLHGRTIKLRLVVMKRMSYFKKKSIHHKNVIKSLRGMEFLRVKESEKIILRIKCRIQRDRTWRLMIYLKFWRL